MNEPAIERRVFVVGVPRSGTTLVQSLLAAHSQVTSFPESHLFRRYFFPLGRTAVLTRSPLLRVEELLRDLRPEAPTSLDAWNRLEARLARTPRLALPWHTREVARGLVRVLDELASERGFRVWVEKTPQNLTYLDFLESCLLQGDQAKTARLDFVHVVREGPATVASLVRASRQWTAPTRERAFDPRSAARRWNRDLRRSLARVDSPRDHFVFYEALTSRPETEVRRLLKQLELAWEPEVLKRYAPASRSLVTENESWKQQVERPIAPSRGGVDALTETERSRLAGWLDADLYRRLEERAAAGAEPRSSDVS